MDKQNQEMDKLSFIYSVLDDQTSKHKAEDGSDVSEGAIDLGFRGAPLMVQQVGITRTYLRFS